MWIILQPSTIVRRRLKDLYATASKSTLYFSDHLGVHAMLFMGFAHRWRDYINFLEDRLVELVE